MQHPRRVTHTHAGRAAFPDMTRFQPFPRIRVSGHAGGIQTPATPSSRAGRADPRSGFPADLRSFAQTQTSSRLAWGQGWRVSLGRADRQGSSLRRGGHAHDQSAVRAAARVPRRRRLPRRRRVPPCLPRHAVPIPRRVGPQPDRQPVFRRPSPRGGRATPPQEAAVSMKACCPGFAHGTAVAFCAHLIVLAVLGLVVMAAARGLGAAGRTGR